MEHHPISFSAAEHPYRTYSDFLQETFPDGKVQKVAIDAGCSCPNRDGTKGVGGCSYCNNRTFSPEYCRKVKPIGEQMQAGIRFFARKYASMKYLAYFQAYTNTYGSAKKLIQKYEEALSCPDVVGLVVSTRPDCMSEELLHYFGQLAKRCFVLIEYGIESTLDRTLKRVNRCHTEAETEATIRRTAEEGIFVGAHLILGLPGESREEMLHHADVLSELPISTLKIHQLQLIKGTRMAREMEDRREDFHFFSVDEYIDLVIDFLERLNPSIAVERFVSQSPKSLLIAPDWGLKSQEFAERIARRFAERDTWQGRLFNLNNPH